MKGGNYVFLDALSKLLAQGSRRRCRDACFSRRTKEVGTVDTVPTRALIEARRRSATNIFWVFFALTRLPDEGGRDRP